MTGSMQRQSFRYLLIGAANTLLGNLAYFVAVTLGLPHQAALGLNYVLGGAHGYLWHCHWTFQATGRHAAQVPRFLLVIALNYGLNAVLLEALVRLGLEPRLAQLGCLAFTTAFGFVGHRYFSFARTPDVTA